ncbi:TSC22 domain family protein 4 [Crotalus adamanteus]|uniref:TSC22 domain family protein 4 n=1 Tax=Crotalus adamanteus TaxID=8729 RepID=A0AAW1B8T9_CROAD
MSVGKKKSGFQITSVTSDYGKEGPPGGDAKGPSARLADEPSPVENGSHHPDGGTGPKNGPLAPGSPGLAPLLPGPTGCVSGSRFRVVKLDHGLGEPYKRGRWTCRDFYEQEMDYHVVGRLADSARQPQSLDSRLEVAGLLAKPSLPFSPPMPRQGRPCLQSLLVLPGATASAHQARSLGGGLPVLRPGRTPPSAASLQSPRVAAETRPLAPEEGAQEPGDPPPLGTIPLVRVEGQLLPKSVTQLIPRETEERQKILPRETRSRPSSPAPLLFREASPHRRTSDPFGVARFNLARSVFGMGAGHDSDDDRPQAGEAGGGRLRSLARRGSSQLRRVGADGGGQRRVYFQPDPQQPLPAQPLQPLSLALPELRPVLELPGAKHPPPPPPTQADVPPVFPSPGFLALLAAAWPSGGCLPMPAFLRVTLERPSPCLLPPTQTSPAFPKSLMGAIIKIAPPSWFSPAPTTFLLGNERGGGERRVPPHRFRPERGGRKRAGERAGAHGCLARLTGWAAEAPVAGWLAVLSPEVGKRGALPPCPPSQ